MAKAKQKKAIKKVKKASKPKVKEIPSEIIINDDFSYVSPKDGKTYRMQPKEKLFCEAYLELKGDGVEAIIEAGYDVYKKDKQGNELYPNRKLAAVMAYENLRKPNLIAYVDSKLEEYGFNDESVKRQHLFLLNQFADLTNKGKAVDMFYKLKGSYAPEKAINFNVNADVTHNEKAQKVADKYEEELKKALHENE